MVITYLSEVTLTTEEHDAIVNNLVVPWPNVFDNVSPGSSQYLSYIGEFGGDMEELANWRWLGDAGSRPDDTTLLAAFATYAAQLESESLEAARVAKWEAIVAAEVSEDFENIPGWFSWTEEEALAWYDTNVEPELISFPKTSQALKGVIRMLLTIRNWIRPDLEGSS